jgi:transcription-repair coupling factor (superfamily II helicase)
MTYYLTRVMQSYLPGLRVRRQLQKSSKAASWINCSNINSLSKTLKNLESYLHNSKNVTITSPADGSYAYLIAEILKSSDKDMLFITHDSARAASFAEQIEFFKKDILVVSFPAWDTIPYDRASPSQTVINDRIKALKQLSHGAGRKVLITPVNSIIQKTLPKEVVAENIISHKVGDKVDTELLVHSLIKIGYTMSDIASEPGDVAVRGSIIDIVPIGKEAGLRLDFFGSSLEAIKKFDTLTQITSGSLKSIEFLPASEVIYNEDTIANFKKAYKRQFNTTGYDDPLYESVSDGRKFAGYEQWLPCFYSQLANIFSYLSKDLIVVLDHLSLQALGERHKVILDYYGSRKEVLKNKRSSDFTYYPVDPAQMWMDPEEFDKKLSHYNVIKLQPFKEENISHDSGIKSLPNFILEAKNNNKTVFDLLKEYRSRVKRTIIACHSEGTLERMKHMLQNHDIHYYQLGDWSEYKNIKGKTIGLVVQKFQSGFAADEFALIAEPDMLGEKIGRSFKKKKLEDILNELSSLNPGEVIVHKDHGIGRFEGLETLQISGQPHDCLKLVYSGGDKLFIPVENVDLISRYGGESVEVQLDKLGGVSWQARKAKLKNRIKIIAAELMKIAAEREVHKVPEITPLAGQYDEFCAKFPYTETDDQLRAIEDIEGDLASGKPMDRLICGDVGFGKTEVALRAAFIVAHAEQGDKQQVAVVVPTTLLARQHYKTFKERMSGFGVSIKQLSRLVSRKELNETKQGLRDGAVDIVVGTHALLAKDIAFKNLGLLIVDEEQHFGVAQKEKLKQLRANVHIISLSATPIPRTLQMSLVGIKDLSLIASPPIDRLVTRTFVMPFDPVIIREAILREHFRGGKSFYVCPRIKDLDEVEKKIKKLVPEIKTAVAHGQMAPAKLDEIMNAFYEGKYDMLISTTIIESGLDVPSANTMFLHRADMFGLSGLYQLRGRVGRGKIRAYAYMLLPERKMINKIAVKRLGIMQTIDSLGAGFSVASHDMDIRGFGNLVGDEQSGHIKEVGMELYQEMLRDAIASLNANEEEVEEEWSPQVNVGLSVLIPSKYVPAISLRMGLYKRIAELKSEEQVENFSAELIDRFGPIPDELAHLLTIVRIKILCVKAHVEKVDAGPKGVIISFKNNNFPKPQTLIGYVLANQAIMKLRGDQKLVIQGEFNLIETKLKLIFKYLNKLIGIISTTEN